MQPPLPLRFRGLDLVGLRQRREQRLRLGDLGHFGRRRKAFERGREHGVGLDWAAGRLIELGERERGAEVEAARALLLSDFDGGSEGVLRRSRVAAAALEQDSRPLRWKRNGSVQRSPVSLAIARPVSTDASARSA